MAQWWSLGLMAVACLAQDSRTVRRSIVGEVLDPAGQAAAGVEVRLWRFAGETLPMGLPHGMNPGLSLLQQMVTGPDGRFRLDAEVGRQYAVSAERAPAERAAPATVVPAGAVLVLRLQPPVVLRGRVLRKVEGDRTEPARDAAVAASSAPEEAVHSAAWPLPAPVPRTVRTGADGRFALALPTIMPGESCTLRATLGTLQAETQAQVAKEVELLLVPAEPQPAQARTVTFVDRATGKPVHGVRVGAVDAGLRSDAEGKVRLSWPKLDGSVLPGRHGRTRLDWTEDDATVPLGPGLGFKVRLLRPDGTPLAQAPVLFGGPVRVDRGSPRYELSNDPWLEHTDAAGRLELHCLVPDMMVFAFVEVDGVYAPLSQLSPTQDLDLGDVRVSLDGVLRGTVLGRNGEPIPDARILLRPECEGAPANTPRSAWPYRLARAGANAAFVVGTIRPGTYLVAAVSDDLRPQCRRIEITARTPAVHFELGSGASLAGTVLLPDGSPAPGAKVSIWIEDPDPELVRFGLDSRSTTSDSQGRFALHGLRAGAPFRLHARCTTGGRWLAVTLEGNGVDSEPVELTLR